MEERMNKLEADQNAVIKMLEARSTIQDNIIKELKANITVRDGIIKAQDDTIKELKRSIGI
ncbi:hypothetical protein DVH05_015765 [Phytophthora capsici]|nr:hypothetical protein DVH05_015765 [Phytophthora capsici]